MSKLEREQERARDMERGLVGELEYVYERLKGEGAGDAIFVTVEELLALVGQLTTDYVFPGLTEIKLQRLNDGGLRWGKRDPQGVGGTGPLHPVLEGRGE